MIVQSDLLKIKKKITTFYLMSRLQRCEQTREGQFLQLLLGNEHARMNRVLLLSILSQ